MSNPFVRRPCAGLSHGADRAPSWRPAAGVPVSTSAFRCGLLVLATGLSLAGCASVAPESDRQALDALVGQHPLMPGAVAHRSTDSPGTSAPSGLSGLSGLSTSSASSASSRASGSFESSSSYGSSAWPASPEIRRALDALLATELDADSAVRIALLNSPRLTQAYATLQLSDAERVQASTLPNPSFAFGRLTSGTERELDRLLRFNVLGLVLLPWQARWAGQRHQVATLQAAQAVLGVAADTRRAWFDAVAAQESLAYLSEAQEAADLGAELAQRMAAAGHWSTAQRLRVDLTQAQAHSQTVQARQLALATRERLTQQMGLGHGDAGYRLPGRLPPLPAGAPAGDAIEAGALQERLDVRAAIADSIATADSLGLRRAAGTFDAMAIGAARNSRYQRESPAGRGTERGLEIELPLPLFDWGQARSARAEALYLQSAARLREVAVRAASEAREALENWRSAHAEALHRRDRVLPMQQRLNEEMLLRYNGMLASAWELLRESQATSLAVVQTIEAQRDFWVADTRLKLALSGPAGGAGAGSGIPLAGRGTGRDPSRPTAMQVEPEARP